MDINAHVLREVAFQLEQGNPWWGIALANRYFEKDSPFRKALARRFVARIGTTKAQSALAQALIAGDSTASFTEGQQEKLGARVVRSQPRVCTPRLRQSNHQRLAVRTRLGASARFTGREINRTFSADHNTMPLLKVVGA
jgi:hypothetical protein